jgi:hypothetical protein
MIAARARSVLPGARGLPMRFAAKDLARLSLRYVVPRDFDEDDSAWLATTISAFLFLAEQATSRTKAG